MTFLTWVAIIANVLIISIILLLILTFLFFRFKDAGQNQHSVLRNFPVLGRVRYFLEKIGPEIRQYLFHNDNEGRPFSRKDYLAVVLAGKYKSRIGGFGSQRDFTQPGFYINNSMFPLQSTEIDVDQSEQIHTQIYEVEEDSIFTRKEHQEKKTVDPYLIPKEQGVTIGQDLQHPHTFQRLIGQSAMSYGALGKNAIKTLSIGIHDAKGSWMNTGEGGISPHHLHGEADLIFQIGPGLFGVRNLDGTFSEELYKKKVALNNVKAVELKLGQGAKTRGGHVEGEKVTEEIAEIRNVEPFKTINSPNRFEFIDNSHELLHFVQKLRELGQKPVGFKIVVGNIDDIKQLVQAMKETNIVPDFISIDGGEGGTGASYQELEDSVGLPILTALPIVDMMLTHYGLRERTKIISSGKLITPDKVAIALGLGADLIQVARSMMMSVGCIMALQCHTNECPVGVATTNPKLERGLVIEEKRYRVTNYLIALSEGLYNVSAAVGVTTPTQINASHIAYRNEYGEVANGYEYKAKLWQTIRQRTES